MNNKSTILKISLFFLCAVRAHALSGMQKGVEQELYLSNVQDDWCMVDHQEPAKPIPVKKDPLLVQAENLQKAVGQVQAVFAQEKDMFFVMMRRTSPNFCEEVEQALINNFQNTGIDHRQVYKFIGLTLLRAKNMSHTRILKLLNSKHKAGELTDRQHRQLEYPFKTACSKEEYDAFCQGRLAELVLSEHATQAMLQKFGKVTNFGLKLADLEVFTRQLAEQVS